MRPNRIMFSRLVIEAKSDRCQAILFSLSDFKSFLAYRDREKEDLTQPPFIFTPEPSDYPVRATILNNDWTNPIYESRQTTIPLK